MHDEFIGVSLSKYSEREKKIKEQIKGVLTSKSMKARSMSRNLMDDRKSMENEIIETNFANFVKKLKKTQEKKKEIEEQMKNQLLRKKNKEKQKETEVKKRLVSQERESFKKFVEIEKNSYQNMQKKIQEKQEKHKNKMIQNEIGILSARTRISRINTQYVYNI